MKSSRVFVAKLPPGVTDDMFSQYFAEFGELVDAYMPKDRTRQHYRGIGFVHYKKEKVAEQVVSRKHRFFGHLVIVDFASPRAANTHQHTAEDTKTKKVQSLMMLHNLIVWSSEHDQQKTPSGELDENYLLPTPTKDPVWGPSSQDIGLLSLSKSWAPPGQQVQPLLCTQESWENGETLLRKLSQFLKHNGLPPKSTNTVLEEDGTLPSGAEEDKLIPAITADEQDNSECSGSDAPESPQAPSSTSSGSSYANHRSYQRVYVGRVPPQCTESDLLNCFTPFGAVSDVYLPRSKADKSKHRGFGFVSFYSDAPLKKMAEHGPVTLQGTPLALDYAMP